MLLESDVIVRIPFTKGNDVAVDKIPPAGLHPRLVKILLDKLETDETFRSSFAASPEQALRLIGYTDPWACLQLKDGAKLASPAQIKAQRSKLESSLTVVHGMICALDEQAGG